MTTAVGERQPRALTAALESDDPRAALRGAVRDLLADGYERKQLLRVLEELRETLRMQRRDDEEHAVLEVMDVLAGWASSYTEDSFFDGLPSEARAS